MLRNGVADRRHMLVLRGAARDSAEGTQSKASLSLNETPAAGQGAPEPRAGVRASLGVGVSGSP
jgi:hypothetical protein